MSRANHKWADAPARTRSLTADEARRILSDIVRLCHGEDCDAEQGHAWIIDAGESLDNILMDLDIDESPEAAKTSLDLIFHTSLPMATLEPMLKRPGRHTVGDLCQCVAGQVAIDEVEPVMIMGRESWEAAVFRLFRRALGKAGADVSGLRPSSPLEPYLKEHGLQLWLLASRIAPGALAANVEPVYSRTLKAVATTSSVLFVAGWLSMVVGAVLMYTSSSAAPAALAPLGLVVVIVGKSIAWSIRRARPRGYRWGEMTTFGDLASALATRFRTTAATGQIEEERTEQDLAPPPART